MTCDELLERLVDPASASQGGHTAVVEHLQGCDRCRAASKAFGAVERLYRSEPAGAPPEEFDRRVLDRIASIGTRPRTAFRVSPFALGLAAVVTAAIALVILRPSTPRVAGASPTTTAKGAPAAEGTVPPILAVNSEPVNVTAPPLSPEEKARVAGFFDASFLRSVDTLAALDPFFSEDVRVSGLAGPPAPRPTAAAVRPSETEEALEDRLADWRRLPAGERKRIADLDVAFRARPEDERAELVSRWKVVSALSPEEQAGLRRIAARLGELDARGLGGLKAEIRKVAAQPKEKRLDSFRATSFAKTLTGQEAAVAERLIAG